MPQAFARFVVVCVVVGFFLCSNQVLLSQGPSKHSLNSFGRPLPTHPWCANPAEPTYQPVTVSPDEARHLEKLCALASTRDETAVPRHAESWDQGDDAVVDELRAMGEQGLLILRAREEVLEILRGQNRCSAWLGQREPDAIAKFRSLRYRIEQAGPEYTFKIQSPDRAWLYQQPYVASSLEGAGAGSTITINGRGAFFHLRSPTQLITADGGPEAFAPSQMLHLDLYVGGTLRAQVLALVHEFSHIAGVLPADGGGLAGRELSTQNTQVVLGHCRAQVEAAGRRKSEKRTITHTENLPAGTRQSWR